ncbi:MAG: GNAT family N-acetyltransferase [Halobacteriota archaeon]
MTVVRPAGLEHVAGIRRVCTRAWWDTYEGLIPDEEIEATLETYYDTDRLTLEVLDPDGWDGWLVAIDDGDVVGAGGGGMVEADVGEVYVLYVDPTAQRRGIGTRLLEHMTTQQRAQGATAQVVSVAEGNEIGRRFYEKHGFELVGDRPTFGETLSGISLRFRRSIPDDGAGGAKRNP